MQASKACRLRFSGVKFVLSETNRGAVLNGFMIGSKAPIVSAMALRKWLIILVRPVPRCGGAWRRIWRQEIGACPEFPRGETRGSGGQGFQRLDQRIDVAQVVAEAE